MIDDKLKAEQEEHGKRLRSGKWSPSSFGYCYRKQYWNRLNEPQSNPPDERTLRVFRCGHLFHDFVQEFFVGQTEVKVDVKDVFGYADIVLSDEVIDIKSVHSYQFHYTTKQGFDIAKEKYTNILQTATYAVLLNKPKFRLVFVSKDDLCIEEYGFVTDKWKAEVEKELANLRSLWDAKTLPPAHPRAFKTKDEFKECRSYCGYKDRCIKEGHVIPPEVKKEKKNANIT
jgi:hypothetical protein